MVRRNTMRRKRGGAFNLKRLAGPSGAVRPLKNIGTQKKTLANLTKLSPTVEGLVKNIQSKRNGSAPADKTMKKFNLFGRFGKKKQPVIQPRAAVAPEAVVAPVAVAPVAAENKTNSANTISKEDMEKIQSFVKEHYNKTPEQLKELICASK